MFFENHSCMKPLLVGSSTGMFGLQDGNVVFADGLQIGFYPIWMFFKFEIGLLEADTINFHILIESLELKKI